MFLNIDISPKKHPTVACSSKIAVPQLAVKISVFMSQTKLRASVELDLSFIKMAKTVQVK